MSIRPRGARMNGTMQMQTDLKALKETAIAANRADVMADAAVEGAESFDSLTDVERAAASLGVHPEAWRPIGFMNSAHHERLQAENRLDPDLARRIQAFAHVSQQ